MRGYHRRESAWPLMKSCGSDSGKATTVPQIVRVPARMPLLVVVFKVEQSFVSRALSKLRHSHRSAVELRELPRY